jgi:hypothetical protein
MKVSIGIEFIRVRELVLVVVETPGVCKKGGPWVARTRSVAGRDYSLAMSVVPFGRLGPTAVSGLFLDIVTRFGSYAHIAGILLALGQAMRERHDHDGSPAKAFLDACTNVGQFLKVFKCGHLQAQKDVRSIRPRRRGRLRGSRPPFASLTRSRPTTVSTSSCAFFWTSGKAHRARIKVKSCEDVVSEPPSKSTLVIACQRQGGGARRKMAHPPI